MVVVPLCVGVPCTVIVAVAPLLKKLMLQLKPPLEVVHVPVDVLRVTEESPAVVPVTTRLKAVPAPLFLTFTSYDKELPMKSDAGFEVSVIERSATLATVVFTCNTLFPSAGSNSLADTLPV